MRPCRLFWHIRFNVVSHLHNLAKFFLLEAEGVVLWPGRDLVKSYMPQVFADFYPDTRVIIDTTEIFIEAPSLPELPQITFSLYKNRNTFKGLVGISPGGIYSYFHVKFVAWVYYR